MDEREVESVNAEKISGEYFLALAKAKNQTLEEFFKENPHAYWRYRELSTIKI